MGMTAKKILSILLTAALLFSIGIPAKAVRADGYTEWTSTNSLPTTSGKYILMNSVTLTNAVTYNDATLDITIDLNGKSITQTGQHRVFVIQNGVLTIEDSSGTNAGTISGGVAGYDLGSSDEWNHGGLVFVNYRGTFILKDGTLTNGRAYGDPKGSQTKGATGGAVYVRGGRFTMEGGIITGCEANYGGAIGIEGRGESGKQDSLQLFGGEIYGNKALGGGSAIRMYAHKGHPVLELAGNTRIYGNTCEKNPNYILDGNEFNVGGAVLVNGCSVKISGDVEIKDNICNYSDSEPRNDLYFVTSSNVTVTGTLSSTPSIGLACYPGVVSGFKVYDMNKDANGGVAFINEMPDYKMEIKNKQLVFSELPKILGYNASLGGGIYLECTVSIPSAYQNSNLEVDATYSYDKAGTVTEVPVNFKYGVNMSATNGQATVSIPVFSACMTSDITITLKYNGEVIKTYTESLYDYAKTIIEGSYSANEKKAAQAMLEYGLYAQVHFDINNSSALYPTVDNANYGVSYSANGPTSNLTAAAFGKFGDVDDPLGFAGATVTFLAKNTITFYFINEVSLTVNGNAINAIQKGDYYAYQCPLGGGISAKEFDSAYTVSVSYGGNSATEEYSVLTYLAAVYNNQENATSMHNLVKAYYNYAMAVKALG